jgi:thioredoxin reductase
VSDKKTLAIILGSAAGLAAAVYAATWYMKSHSSDDVKTVQDKIQWAQQKLEELEQVANVLKKPLSAA